MVRTPTGGFRSSIACQAIGASCWSDDSITRRGILGRTLLHIDAGVANDLRTRCSKWQAALTDMLSGLDSRRPVVEVRREANELVGRLVKVLGELG